MRRHVHEIKSQVQFVIPKGSFLWELEQIRKDEREQNMQRTVIGRNNVRSARR